MKSTAFREFKNNPISLESVFGQLEEIERGEHVLAADIFYASARPLKHAILFLLHQLRKDLPVRVRLANESACRTCIHTRSRSTNTPM